MKSIIGYRSKVIDENLKNSFPSLSHEELSSIKSKFYTNLTDILLESFKGPFIKHVNFKKHYYFSNAEVVDQYFNADKDIIMAGTHYTNWEWGTYATGLMLNHQIIGLYKPVNNPILNNHISKTRESTGIKMIPIKETRSIFTKTIGQIPRLFVFLADQSPSNTKDAIWVDFLHQQTPCLHGIEKYSKKHDIPVIFSDVVRIKRGHYKIEFILITDSPNELKDGEITARYMNLLERRIMVKPEDWLWSHRRWKHKFSK